MITEIRQKNIHNIIISMNTIYLVGCHKSKRQKCFQNLRHCVVRIQGDGIWRCGAREKQEPISFLYRAPKDFPFATPESADLWNRATRVLH